MAKFHLAALPDINGASQKRCRFRYFRNNIVLKFNFWTSHIDALKTEPSFSTAQCLGRFRGKVIWTSLFGKEKKLDLFAGFECLPNCTCQIAPHQC